LGTRERGGFLRYAYINLTIYWNVLGRYQSNCTEDLSEVLSMSSDELILYLF